MKSYIEYFRDSVTHNGDADLHSIIQQMCQTFWAHHSSKNNAPEFCEQQLAPLLTALSRKRRCRLFYLVTCLCDQCQNDAFADGFTVGARFALELMDWDKNE